MLAIPNVAFNNFCNSMQPDYPADIQGAPDDESFKFIDIICVISLYFEPPREIFTIEQAPQMDLTGEGGGRHIHCAEGDRKERHNCRAVSMEEGKRERIKRKTNLLVLCQAPLYCLSGQC